MARPSVEITRRRALLAASLAAGAAFAPAWPGGRAWGASRLAVGRAATYGRLVGTLRRAPDGRFCARGAAAAAREFARWYAAQDAAVRAHADAVLDALRLPGDYAALARAVHPTAGADAVLVVAAVGLAAVTCTPPPAAEDDRPLAPALSSPFEPGIIDVHAGSAHAGHPR